MAPARRIVRARLVAAGAVLALIARAAVAQPVPEQKFPDVVAVEVRLRGADVFDFEVTVSSRYDTPKRYADGFRVSGRGGVVYGERTLLHDHAGEQPFTRELVGVKVPPGVRSVVVQARDLAYGYGGATVQVTLPGRE